jgi:hypothetical protein
MGDPKDPPDGGVPQPPVSGTPGGAGTTVTPGATPCCMVNHGEFADEYLTLNGLWMVDLLKKLETGGRDHLIALRGHVAEASGVFNGRLITAMDAVYYRNFEPTLRGIGEQLVQSDLEAFLQFEMQQRTEVSTYMRADNRPPSAPRPAPTTSGGTPFPSSQLGAYGTAEQTTFKRQVYDAHVAAAQHAGRKFSADLDAGQLTVVEGGQRMRSDAASGCLALLTKARADLAAAQGTGDALAVAATSIGAGSCYRSATQELAIWESLFPQYYTATQDARAAADGGEHGPAAVAILVRHYSGRKAAPGFGNHTAGVAVDFVTTQGGTVLGANVSQNPAWIASWLHVWLVAHAASDFNFKPIATEAWHWEFRP